MRSIVKKILFVFFAVALCSLLYAPSSSADDAERQIQGNYGVDIYVFFAWNNRVTVEDHLYLPGYLGRADVRAIGWPALLISDELDVYKDRSLIITVYYNSAGHAAMVILTGDIVI